MIIMMLNIEVRINNESILTKNTVVNFYPSKAVEHFIFLCLHYCCLIVVAVPLGILLSKRNAQLMWY